LSKTYRSEGKTEIRKRKDTDLSGSWEKTKRLKKKNCRKTNLEEGERGGEESGAAFSNESI